MALGDPQRVLVAFIALTLIVVAGFTRFNVDTEPGLLVDDGAAFDDSLTVVFVGERSLMTAPILAAISSLHRNARQIDGVEGADVISIASLMGSSVPTDRLSVREFAASTGNDALAGVVVSADRLALTMVVPLKSTADPGSIRIELEGLISADSELSALRHEVAGVVLARQRTVDHLYGQAVARTVLGWGLGFLVLLVVFRRPLIAFVASALIGATVVWAMAIIAAFGATILVPDSIVPAALVVVATAHVVRVIAAAHFHGEIREAPGRVLGEISLSWARSSLTVDAVLIAALLTVAAASPILRSLALSLIVGLIVAWLLTVTVVSSALAALGPNRYARSKRDADGDVVVLAARGMVRFGVHRRDGLLGVVSIVVGLGAVGVAMVSVDDSFLRWVPTSGPEAQGAALVDAEGIGTTSTVMALEARHPNQLISRSNIAALDALEDLWTEDPLIGESFSFWHLVRGDDPAARRQSFEAIRLSHRFGADIVDTTSTQVNIRVWLRNADSGTIRHLFDVTTLQLADEGLGYGVEMSWSGEGVDNIEWQDKVVRDTAWWSLVGVAALLTAAVVAFGSIRWAAVSLAPGAVVFLGTFGLLGWIDGSYGLPSMVGGLLLVLVVSEVGLYVSLAYRTAGRHTWSPMEAADEVVGGTALGLGVAGLVAGASMVPLALADLLPNGRPGEFMLLAAIVGTVLAPTVVIAAASGPPRNTAPL